MSTVLQQPPSGGAPQSSLLPHHLHPHAHHSHHLHHRPAAELQAAAHNPDVLLALLARNKALEGKRTIILLSGRSRANPFVSCQSASYSSVFVLPARSALRATSGHLEVRTQPVPCSAIDGYSKTQNVIHYFRTTDTRTGIYSAFS